VNLYLLLAIAFGAISGFPEPVAAPRALAQIVDVRDTRASRRRIAAPASSSRIVTRRESRPAALSFQRVEAPLTGSASPRAPAI
jgi:hypothetical protein